MKSLFNNWQLKFFSFLAAALLWMFVVGIENTVYLLPETLEVKTLDLGKTFSIQEKIPPIKLYIRTEGDMKKTLNKNDFEVSIDLSGKQSGTYSVPVLVTTSNPKISIVKVDPANVQVIVVPIMEKQVKVATKVKGNPLKAYHLDGVESMVDKVKIKAGQSTLDKIQQLDAVVTLNGNEDTTFKQTVSLTIPENLGITPENISIEPENVELKINIKADEIKVTTQETTEISTTTTAQTTIISPIILSGSNPDFSVQKITPSTLQITVEGTPEQIKNLQYDDVGITIDLSEIPKPGDVTILAKWIKIPESMTLKSWAPQGVIIAEK